MPKVTDISSKRLISLLPDEWTRWVTGQDDLLASHPIDAEFEFISRQTDALVMVTSARHGRFLVLTEVQLRYRVEMPYRMHAYAALAAEKYRLPVYPVLVNILPASETATIPTCYESEVLGLRVRQEYRVINLWEMEAEMVLGTPLPVLSPFVPAMKGGDTAEAVRPAVDLMRTDERMKDFEGLLGVLAGLKLSMSIVEQIVRLDMSLVRETTWFEEALQEGLQQGLQAGIEQGMRQGMQQGMQQGMRQQLVHVLEHRFGPVGEDVLVKLRSVEASRLEDLIDVALDAESLDDFAAHLS
jgi:predicted transposase YdaD